ncbi:DNA helicase, ATP-dependent, RecQ type [Artemisia annua]|uniref:DNA helicase, ATP-dependent, RecQ type n=1 Tax=Artemisia annua TaxID=35608 RepID=A0A2U1PKF1_ARTAN|nr:DNA helicase, ATP-dependent, RecQ type [Artemisia annua]
MTKSKCVGDSRGADTSMRNNLHEHAKSYDNSPSQDKILKSNFLFSLTPQKHSVGETMSATARSFSFKVQNVTKAHGPQVDKNSKNMGENLVNANQGEKKKEVVVIDISSDESPYLKQNPPLRFKRSVKKNVSKTKEPVSVFSLIDEEADEDSANIEETNELSEGEYTL